MTDCKFAIDNKNSEEFICGVIEGFYGKPWTYEQRHDLFKRLKDFNLNTFLYAPKDDCKHRANWRQLYSESEAKELKSLIEAAKNHGIDFYYSLAPGLDMVYSDQNDQDLLTRKYDQIVELGCECFAILFDDIKPAINDKDTQIFKSYAAAQVSVTNMIYEHLNRPKFLFCPTEYCESRTVPNLSDSYYLNTLGTGLDEGIDIMWTGSRVISRLITEESIENLTKVIRRPPIIWENLHANDYDKKRVFLGPYSGRSTRLINKLRGILTNPNCEYEANHIAINTLAQWSKCTQDINQHNRCDSRQRTEEPPSSDDNIDGSVYDPNRALGMAIKDWLPRVLDPRPYPPGVSAFVLDTSSQRYERKDESASVEISKKNDGDHNVVDMMIAEESTQSSSGASTNTNKSDMDTSISVGCPMKSPVNINETNSCDSCEMRDANQIPSEEELDSEGGTNITKTNKTTTTAEVTAAVAKNISQTADNLMGSLDKNLNISNDSNKRIRPIVTFEDLSILIELFFLPFEHGCRGLEILNELRWLSDNSGILLSEDLPDCERTEARNRTTMHSSEMVKAQEEDDSGSDSQDVIECHSLDNWRARADKLSVQCSSIAGLANTMIYECPNKPLVVELYPYLADLRDSMGSLIEYINFLRCRSSLSESFDGLTTGTNKEMKRQYKQENLDDEQEPWVHRGGLMGDIYRLLYR